MSLAQLDRDGSDELRVLTDEQEPAASRRAEALLLSAGAGSGKTSVLVERFVRAVREDGTAPAQILAITFTERAAGELRARVRERLLDLGEREAARDTEAAFVGTIHGFCARILRSHARLAGLDPGFSILEEGLASRLRAQAFTLALRAFLEGERGDAVELVAAYEADRVRTMVESAYLALRTSGQRAPRLPAPVPAADADETQLAAASACVLLDELLRRFGESCEQLKRERGAVDFDDLELLTRELLEGRRAVREAWSQRFSLLMVDEFQDTNPRQLAILRALDRDNLFTVGDELQAIYGFRHADVRLFRRRRDELAARGASLRLTRNFRSRAALLEVVNAVFSTRFEDFTPLVPGRIERARAGEQLQLEGTGDPARGEGAGLARGGDAGLARGGGAGLARGGDAGLARGDRVGPARGGAEDEPAVELLLSSTRGWEDSEQLAAALARGMPPALLWRQAEAHLLAERLAEIVASGRTRPGEVAVLLRASGDIEVYERALQLRGLSTLATVGGFWAHQQVSDLLCYLAAIANPLDEVSLYGALGSPLAGCSSDALALLAREARAAGAGAFETARRADESGEMLAVLAAGERERLVGFCSHLAREREAAAPAGAAELIERALSRCGYRDHVLSLQWGERRLANVHKLMRIARRFEAEEGHDLRAFLDYAAYLARSPGGVEPDAPVEGEAPEAVRLMTIHAAKGLEFPVVCVADLGRMPNNRMPDLLVDGERIGLRLVRLDGQSGTGALDYEELCAERACGQAEEEERIVYVAMTRPRELLLLSGGVDFERWPEPRPGANTISWLAPALIEELPALAASGERELVEVDIGERGLGSVRCRLASPARPAALGLERLQTGPSPRAQPAPPAAAPAAPVAAPSLEPVCATPAPAGLRGGAALSYTAIAELERCGYRYYLERVLGLREERAERSRESKRDALEARARGTLLHRLLEHVDFARPRIPDARQVGGVARELGLRVSAGEREEIRSLLRGATHSRLAARLAKVERVRREHGFAFALAPGQRLVSGVIDLLCSEPAGELVIDYKSDRIDDEDALDALVEREYGVQRLIYALAVLRSGVARVEVVHWFLQRPQEWVSATFQAPERGRLEGLLAERIAASQEHGFAVSAMPHRGICEGCPGRGTLCSWDQALTLREPPQG
jgi:ATP-dependent helicase/nuclease subunit A